MLFLFISGIGCQGANNDRQPLVKKEENFPSANRIRINIGNEPYSLDPAKAHDLRSVTLVKMLLDGLVQIGRMNHVEMGTAERVEISEDKRTYLFTLRDTKWSNGDILTADDFVYAWKRVLSPSVIAESAFHLYPIKNARAVKTGELTSEELGVLALDAKTLKVELEQPTPYFLELASHPVYYPVNKRVDQENSGWANSPETYVGNGPFALKQWRHGDLITVKKNPYYWDQGVVKLDEIAMYMLQPETELSMFENGEVDWAGSPFSLLPIDTLGKLKKEHLLFEQPILGTCFLRLNNTHPFLSSKSIRRALSASINRSQLVENALGGCQVAATGYIPAVFGLQQLSSFQVESREASLGHLEEGLQLLKMRDVEMPVLEIIYAFSERNQRIVQLLQEVWQKELGIRTKLSALEPKIYFDKVARGDYEVALGSWMADFNDPVAFLEIFRTKTTGANHTRWENESYRALLDASTLETDSDIRQKLLISCENILLEELPVIPLFHFNLLYVKDSKLQDLFISNLGVIDFRWARVQ
jgi:oligopeptide transport system substrate-binding protein